MMWNNFVLYMTNWSLLLDGELQTNVFTCAKSTHNNNYESFFYNKDSKVCIMNNAKIHTTTNMVASDGFIYYVLHGPKCGPPPVISNAVLDEVVQKSGDVYTAYYSCNTGFYSLVKTLTCSGFTWSSDVYCKAIESCSDVKQCNPGYLQDGEYWLYPNVYDNNRIKIYCYGMAKEGPIEYVTLVNSNVMEYPQGEYIIDGNCQVITGSRVEQGKTKFNKVRVLPQNMTLEGSDMRFATQVDGTFKLTYGTAFACSIHELLLCPQRGRGRIDVTSTGFVFGASNEWYAWGWHPLHAFVSRTDHVIALTGDGACGGAAPKEPIILELDPFFRPPLNSATIPLCSL